MRLSYPSILAMFQMSPALGANISARNFICVWRSFGYGSSARRYCSAAGKKENMRNGPCCLENSLRYEKMAGAANARRGINGRIVTYPPIPPIKTRKANTAPTIGRYGRRTITTMKHSAATVGATATRTMGEISENAPMAFLVFIGGIGGY